MKMSFKNYSLQWIELVKELSWAEWNRLGLRGTDKANLYSIDIEAAILLAILAMRHDARLLEGVHAWLKRYERIINGERLSALIRYYKSEALARGVGGMIESAALNTLKTTVLTCRKLCTDRWEAKPLLRGHRPAAWKTLDTQWQSWGYLVEKIEARTKLQDHQEIMRNNVGIRYRYLYGTSFRADILYLLSASHHCRAKREVDFLTTAHLADVFLGCHRSTVYRIQQDLEDGGILHPQRELKNQYVVTWSPKEVSVFLDTPIVDKGLMQWIRIHQMLFAVVELGEQLEKTNDESIAMFAISQFHEKWFPLLIDHRIPVPTPYGKALGPLKAYRVEQLAEMTTRALHSLFDFITAYMSSTATLTTQLALP